MAKNRVSLSTFDKTKLWAATAGFCEYPGCGKFLLEDNHTKKRTNLSTLAHIIAYSPGGPRGDSSESQALQTDPENIILLCRDHGKLIDDDPESHPAEVLRGWKSDHETSIKRFIETPGKQKTKVLRFIAHIGDQKPEISDAEIKAAIYPNYVSEILTINYTNLNIDGDIDYWANLATETKRKIEIFLADGQGSAMHDSISIFGLAPIPLLAWVGRCLGDKANIHLFQRHRDTNDWKWTEDHVDDFEYIVTKSILPSKNAAIVLELSGKIEESELKAVEKMSVYKITVPMPNPGFLKTRRQLSLFQEQYGQMLAEIRSQIGNDGEIHILAAVPPPIAISLGLIPLAKITPKTYIYDNKRVNGGFTKILKIN